ncbi:MAG: hypothetical protein P0Y53_10430 [Candidatus Pseudobacter hemicellulosilyticus]|uniref:Uncharacterized protein n=1 Tax=Candidatus Pseudobacter hemicellulosilyticus TaxID=3121375 RepID=A0AAJ5WW73_9BACT|nr:MAG: hypothetical protein P0Y53_10430 [Pseudobacter sp.]
MIGILFILLFLGCQWRYARLRKKSQSNTTHEPLDDQLESLSQSNFDLEAANLFKYRLLGAYNHHMGVTGGSSAVVADQLFRNWQQLSDTQKLEWLGEIREYGREEALIGIQLRQWQDIMDNNRRLAPTALSVSAKIKGVEEDLSDVLQLRNNQLVDATDELLVQADRKLFNTLLFNLVIGANRWMKNGSITVSAELQEPNLFVLEVADQASGPQAEEVRHTLQQWLAEEGLHRTEEARKWKIGYLAVMDLLELVQGSMQVTLNEKGGTTVRLLLPQ